MRVSLVAPVPLGALLVGWAVGWSIGVVVIVAACLSASASRSGGHGMPGRCGDETESTYVPDRKPAYAVDRHRFHEPLAHLCTFAHI